MESGCEVVSVFIVHWNQPTECASTVRQFLAQGIPLEITIVDNASTAEALTSLEKATGNDALIMRLRENKGWGGALNVVLEQWLREKQNSYCFISAHDAVLDAKCLDILLVGAKADRRIGVASPQYRDPFVSRVSRWRGVYPELVAAQPAGTAQTVEAPHGTVMLLRRECLNEIGLFDERYFAYGDEHELGLRAVRRGWKVAMIWGAIVTNPGTWTPSPLRSYLFTRNSLLLVRDYFGWLSATARAVLLMLNTLRLLVRPGHGEFAFSVKARFQGVRDFFRGHYGKPHLR